MLSLVEGCYDAIEECKKEEYNLDATLDYLIAHCEDYNDVSEKRTFEAFPGIIVPITTRSSLQTSCEMVCFARYS